MGLWASLRTRIVAGAVAAVLAIAAALLVVLDILVRGELEKDASREALAMLETFETALEPVLSPTDHLAVRRFIVRAVGAGRVLGISVLDGERRVVAAEPPALAEHALLGELEPGVDGGERLSLRGVPASAAFRPITRSGDVVGAVWLALDLRPLELAVRRFRMFATLLIVAILGVTMMVATLAAEHLVQPLDRLGDTIAALGRGELETRHAVAGPDEMQRLARRVNRMAEQLGTSRASLSRLAADLENQVHGRTRELEAANRRLSERHTDPLTGLTNRRGLEIELERYLSLCRRNRQPLAVIMMDLDNFKRYNDSCGHLSGDTVLRSVGAALLGRARASDVVSRWGGDEFCILVPATDTSGAVAAARRFVLSVLEAMGDLSRQDVSAVLGASAGVACYPEDGEEGVELVARADAALYRVKAAGGSAVLRLEPTDDDGRDVRPDTGA